MPIAGTILGVERDIEYAVYNAIQTLRDDESIAIDGLIPEACEVCTWSGIERPRDNSVPPERDYPFIYIECDPATFQGLNTSKYDGQLAIQIATSANKGADASRQLLSDLVTAVGWILDQADFSSYTLAIASLVLIREGGSATAAEHSAEVTISVRFMACGAKSPPEPEP